MSWPDGLGWWIAGAIGVFWWVGAYNRLVRLRSLALQAYATLDAALVRQLDFVRARAVAEHGADGALHAAIDQLVALLASTRLRPLEPAATAALATALRVLLAAWERLHPEEVTHFDTDGTLSRPAPLEGGMPAETPASPSMAWPEPSAAAEIARGQFNLATRHYNAALRQFPVLLVAWILRLRPAGEL